MKCYIKRDDKMYFSKHIGLEIMQNHWVFDKKEAKMFIDGRLARSTIKKYKLKNCEVEYEELRGKNNNKTRKQNDTI